MQYHYDGFVAGDPHLHPAAQDVRNHPDQVDVLIVGCGPAGLTLAAQLAQFPDITTRIIERKAGPLEMGQADGIACRSMEMFEAFGFVQKVRHEAYWVNETSFWRPDAEGLIRRADRIQDVEDDLSHQPHVILSQARVHDFFLQIMAQSPSRLTPDYDMTLQELRLDPGHAYPVVADCLAKGASAPTPIRARYVVGCDGARSAVRGALGLRLEGRSARQLWGVMDVLAVTDFPDIRLKCAIQSADEGSLLIIPREGGTLVRLYIELDALAEGERAADRDVRPDTLIDTARAILSPYHFEVRQVAWCSAYEIGQRVCPGFDNRGAPRNASTDAQIFIAGDACHTHSPKAGQGMNVSMADAFNLGWKLAAVLRGQAAPHLLETYAAERLAKAQELIDFDREMAALFSARSDDPAQKAAFQRYFQQHGRYTAGVATRYAPSSVVDGASDQKRAKGLHLGTRLHSAPVIRLADARPMQLSEALSADGRWRLVLFAPAGDPGAPDGAVARCCAALDAPGQGLLHRYAGSAPLDLLAVFQQGHRDLELMQMPPALLPARGRLGLTDYEKIYCPDLKSGPDIFDQRGIDRAEGAMVLLRPDQFVAGIYPLDGLSKLQDFLDGILLRR